MISTSFESDITRFMIFTNGVPLSYMVVLIACYLFTHLSKHLCYFQLRGWLYKHFVHLSGLASLDVWHGLSIQRPLVARHL